MRIGAVIIAVLFLIIGLIVSIMGAAAPPLSQVPTHSVRVSSVQPRPYVPPPPPRPYTPSRSNSSSSGRSRYSSGGGFSSGK